MRRTISVSIQVDKIIAVRNLVYGKRIVIKNTPS
jgi:hypothetical protein